MDDVVVGEHALLPPSWSGPDNPSRMVRMDTPCPEGGAVKWGAQRTAGPGWCGLEGGTTDDTDRAAALDREAEREGCF